MSSPDPQVDARDLFFQDDPDLIEVGIGELVIAESPKRLMTPALGSCVALVLYDPFARRGGLGHIMLPGPHNGIEDDSPGRFADYAVIELVRMLGERGSFRRRIQARIAGGAAMFRGESSVSTIGARNVAAVKRQLALMSIPVMAEDTGEAHARTLEITLETGETIVRSYRFGMRKL